MSVQAGTGEKRMLEESSAMRQNASHDARAFTWTLLTAGFLVLLGATTACRAVGSANGESHARPDERYAMVVFLSGSEFFNWAYAGLRDAAAAIGPHVQVELHGPAEWDASLQARAVQQLVARRVDGIVVTAGEAAALRPAINRAIDARIPVITFDSDSPESRRLTFVGTDNYNAGWTAGRTMAEWLGGHGSVGVSTFPGPDHLKRRVDGFRDALAQFGPGIRIAAVVNDEGDVAKAEMQITAMLQANPDITGIFCAHGNPGPGAAAAVRNLGLSGKVQIMAFDFATPVIELIESGEIRGTVGQNPYLMGWMSMLLAYGARHPGSVPDESSFGPVPATIDTGVIILGRDEIARYRSVPKV
jgi:ribose transport system substrate-binding protein